MIKKLLKSKLLILVSFVVTFAILAFLIVTLKQYNDFKPYKKLATELNEQLGGGFKTTYNWRCGLETTNCPSTAMTKSVELNDEAAINARLDAIAESLTTQEYNEIKPGKCAEIEGYSYCQITARHKSDGLVITIGVRPKVISVDIGT